LKITLDASKSIKLEFPEVNSSILKVIVSSWGDYWARIYFCIEGLLQSKE